MLSSLECAGDAYADDSTLSEAGKNVEEVGIKLSQNCETVSDWMSANQLKLNAGKTHLLLAGTAERLRITPAIEVTMDGIRLEESVDKCELLLGVEIQANLKWKSQVNKLIEKLKTRLVGLAKLKYILPFQTSTA